VSQDPTKSRKGSALRNAPATSALGAVLVSVALLAAPEAGADPMADPGTREDRAALFDYILNATMEHTAFSPFKPRDLSACADRFRRTASSCSRRDSQRDVTRRFLGRNIIRWSPRAVKSIESLASIRYRAITIASPSRRALAAQRYALGCPLSGGPTQGDPSCHGGSYP
jgi:hypothetical protein